MSDFVREQTRRASPNLSSTQVFWLVGLLGAWPGLWSDMVFPTLASMASDLEVTASAAQQAVSLFFLANAVMCLWHGVLIDAWGRRRMALVALAMLCVTSVLCAIATSIEQVWLLRIFQGAVVGLGHILCRAIVRDLYSGVAAQHMIGRTSMLQSLVPIILPWFAGWLTLQAGWRVVHGFMFAIAACAWWVYWVRLPETLPPDQRRPIRLRLVVQGYRQVALSAAFVRPAAAHALNWSAMFLYVAAGPVYVTRVLHRPPTDVFVVFVPIMLGLMVGLFLLPHWAKWWRKADTLVANYGLLAVAHVANLLLAWFGVEGGWVLVPMALCSLGIGLCMPVLVARALQPFAALAGMAASLQMFLQYAWMAVTAGWIAPNLWSSPVGLASASAGLSVLGGVLVLGRVGVRAPVRG